MNGATGGTMSGTLMSANLMPSLVSLAKIEGAPARSNFAPEAIEAAATAILEARALALPLVVRQSGFDTFTLLDGALAYHAAARARELDPRRVEKVLAFVAADGQEAALMQQRRVLAEASPGAPADAPPPAPAVASPAAAGSEAPLLAARLDRFEVELRTRLEGLGRQLGEERQAIEAQLRAIERGMPRNLEPLRVLNEGEPRAIAELLGHAGLRGKVLEKIIANLVPARPFASLADAAKRTRGLSADRLLDGVEKWSALSHNRTAGN